MIASLRIATQYGKAGQAGIVNREELETVNVCYAHSREDAVSWIADNYPEAIVDDFADGRFMFTTDWTEYSDVLSSLVEGWQGVGFSRTQIIVMPINTIRVSTGYKGK